jgi:hypothetical protein
VRVLASARDPGGAAQMRALCRALRGDPRLAVRVAASGPAFDLLDGGGEQPIRFTLPNGRTHVAVGDDSTDLLRAAAELLERVNPDVLLVGVSSLGVGLDEALLAQARGRPTFGLQDYPGDANAIGGAHAGTYFVRDEAAARRTQERFDVAVVPVGSLRHAAYAGLDVPRLRAATRDRIGVGSDQPVLGFFGQPPDIPGHETAFEHLVSALTQKPLTPFVLLREHPKSPPDLRARHMSALERAGVNVHDAGAGGVEPWLAACDVVVTCFSHASMDYAFLTAWSPEPLGCTVFLLTTDKIRRFLRDYSGMALPDGVGSGLGMVAETATDVGPVLDRALDPATRQEYHRTSRRLPREARLDVIRAAVLEAGQRWTARPGG